MKLGKSIEFHLRQKGWSITQLSKKSGVSKSTLHAWTVGRKSINLENLKRVAAALEISVHQLVYGEPDPFESVGKEVLKEIFSGDVRITVHRIERKK